MPDALFYAIPRIGFQGVKALTRGHFAKFIQAMNSAAMLLPRQLELRKPLSRKTLSVIRDLKHAPVVERSASSHPGNPQKKQKEGLSRP